MIDCPKKLAVRPRNLQTLALNGEIVNIIHVRLAMRVLSTIISSILILVFLYTGLDKLIRWKQTLFSFHNQTFPSELVDYLAFWVPTIELSITLLLLFSVTRWWGFLGTSLLLSVFTTYIGLIWVGAFPRVPCSCAGILENIGWTEHLVINLILIVVSLVGLWMESRLSKSIK